MRFVILVAVGLSAGAFAQGKRVIDVNEAVNLAVGSSPRLRAAQLQKEGLDDQAKSVRGRMLPLIALNDEAQHYRREFAIQFGPQRFVARNQDTNTFVAAADQPLTGLLGLYKQYESVDASSLAAEAARRGGVRALEEAVRTGYLRYFEAKAAEDIAAASVQQLGEQKETANARLKAGAGTNADVLRVDVAVANAKQQVLAAKSQEASTRAALLIAMGFDKDDGTVEFTEPTALEEASPKLIAEEQAQQLAATQRDEVQRAKYEHIAAENGAWNKKWALLPQIDAEAAWVNVQGQIFAPANSSYVGLKASWPVWEWGATFYAARAADRQADAAKANIEDQERSVRQEASSRLAELTAAVSAVDVAQTAIASAEEAYRVTQALVKAGSATTTDLLDSQAALTQARLNLARARYERAIANVSLERSIGTTAEK
ncbi:MAG: TolC family protein [Myxococcaceae bacterium]